MFFIYLFFQAEDGIRDLVRSRGLGDVYKRQGGNTMAAIEELEPDCTDFRLDVPLITTPRLVLRLSLIHI